MTWWEIKFVEAFPPYRPNDEWQVREAFINVFGGESCAVRFKTKTLKEAIKWCEDNNVNKYKIITEGK